MLSSAGFNWKIVELIHIKCDALRDLVPFVQFKNVKNTHGGVLILVKLQASAWLGTEN